MFPRGQDRTTEENSLTIRTSDVSGRRRGLDAALAETFLPTEGDAVPRWKRVSEKKRTDLLRGVTGEEGHVWEQLLADGAHEAGRVVGFPQDGHQVPLHEPPAVTAQRPVKSLEVQGTEVVAVLHEEARLRQVTATHCGDQTHTANMADFRTGVCGETFLDHDCVFTT